MFRNPNPPDAVADGTTTSPSWKIEPQSRYVASSRKILKDLWRELLRLDSNPSDPEIFLRIVQGLGALNQEAEAWRFSDIERVALALRDIFLDLEARTRRYDPQISRLLMKGLELLSELVLEKEEQFERINSIDRLLDSLRAEVCGPE